MKDRGATIGLALFMVVALTLTWLVYVTLRRDVAGSTVPYAAMVSDVFGLREGDDVRMAGVRVGRVERSSCRAIWPRCRSSSRAISRCWAAPWRR